jgi:lysozyme
MQEWNTQRTIHLVKTFEGLRLTAYRCQADVLTIGWGHTGGDVSEGMEISEDEAEAYLINDLDIAAGVVSDYLAVLLNPNQIGALISFTFNFGNGALLNSTLLDRLNKRQDPNTVAREELPKWVMCKGERLEVLVRRRLAEANLFIFLDSKALIIVKSGLRVIERVFNRSVDEDRLGS